LQNSFSYPLSFLSISHSWLISMHKHKTKKPVKFGLYYCPDSSQRDLLNSEQVRKMLLNSWETEESIIAFVKYYLGRGLMFSASLFPVLPYYSFHFVFFKSELLSGLICMKTSVHWGWLRLKNLVKHQSVIVILSQTESLSHTNFSPACCVNYLGNLNITKIDGWLHFKIRWQEVKKQADVLVTIPFCHKNGNSEILFSVCNLRG
jgi:hypothetical protein